MTRRHTSVWLALLLAGTPAFGWGAAATRAPVVPLGGLGQTGVLGADLAALPAPTLAPALAPAAITILSPALLPTAAPALAPVARPAAQEPPSSEKAANEAGRAFDLSGKTPAEAVSVDGPASPAGLAGITRQGETLYHRGRKLELLGAGSFGRVFTHPREKGAVIKMISHDLGALLAVGNAEHASARQDLEVGRRLADAGVGPQVHGLAVIPGDPSRLHRFIWKLFGREARAEDRPAVVKERVHGATVEDLIGERAFTARDRALVHAMLARMADARLRVSDLRVSNIMIGRTESDPAIRAYLIDGGRLMKVEDAETRDALYRSLLSHQAVIMNVGGGGSAGWGGGTSALDPLDDVLRSGVTRSRKR